MVEAICETDDDLAVKFLLDEEISVEELKQSLRKATIATKIIPVTCGASYKNKGVQLLLDAMVDFCRHLSIFRPLSESTRKRRRKQRARRTTTLLFQRSRLR